MSMKNKSSFSLFAAAFLLMVVAPLFAHHLATGYYHHDAWATITGTVKEFRYYNPHPLLILDVKDDKGNVDAWRVEFNAPSKMTRQFGWSRETFKPGDHITIYGHPYDGGQKVMAPSKVTGPTGKVDQVDAQNAY
jgi:hypothetical protein